MTVQPGTDADVGVIGLGAMGGAMAATLHRAGWNVTGFDPSPDARRAAENAGVKTVAELSALAGLPRVLLSLPAAALVEATLNELLPVGGTRVVIDTTTSDPLTTQAMVELGATTGTEVVDAPVSGGPTGAASGSLTAFVGGSQEAVTAATPVLNSLTGGSFRHVGNAGAGNVVKLLNNLLCATNLVAVAEALDVAAAFGIDRAVASGAISDASGGSTASSSMFPKWVHTGSFDSGFALCLMARDVTLALDVAEQQNVLPTLLQGTRSAWNRALDILGPRADFTQVVNTVSTAAAADHPAPVRSDP